MSPRVSPRSEGDFRAIQEFAEIHGLKPELSAWPLIRFSRRDNGREVKILLSHIKDQLAVEART